jgi:hypothetical protein
MNYARPRKVSEWLKSQVGYLGFEGEAILDPGYSMGGGLPTAIPALPKK